MRIARLLLLVLLFGLLATPALAADSPGAGDAPVDGSGAVVEFEPNPEQEPAVPAWTYRFLIPTFIALTVVVVIGTVVQYFRKVVATRYEPVE